MNWKVPCDTHENAPASHCQACLEAQITRAETAELCVAKLEASEHDGIVALKLRGRDLEEALDALLFWEAPDGQEAVWEHARAVRNGARPPREHGESNRNVEPSAPPAPAPIPIILHCPECRARHIDEGEFKTKVHHTHSCQSCGFTWRPAVVPTVGVQFLPGFKTIDTTLEKKSTEVP